MRPDKLIKEAREWIDTPFHHQGRVKGIGVDCIGLPVGALINLGVTPPDTDGYAVEPDGTFKSVLDRLLDTIPLQKGALILFRIRNKPQHVAIATQDGMIHSYSGGSNKVVEHGLDKFWSDRIIKCYALPEVKYVIK